MRGLDVLPCKPYQRFFLPPLSLLVGQELEKMVIRAHFYNMKIIVVMKIKGRHEVIFG
jgi:hypothetical protein